MVNYNNGKIYKIEAINGEEGDIYIGSTTKELLSQRMDTHRSDYKKYLNGKHDNITSFKLFNKYGVENCKIILIELVNVNSKDELLSREAYYIKSLDCVNKCIPLQTTKEWRESNREKVKQYSKKYRKEYYENNKDKIKEYYEDNKDKIKEYNKKYYEAKKQLI